MLDLLVACCPCFETLASLAPQHEVVVFQRVRPHPEEVTKWPSRRMGRNTDLRFQVLVYFAWGCFRDFVSRPGGSPPKPRPGHTRSLARRMGTLSAFALRAAADKSLCTPCDSRSSG